MNDRMKRSNDKLVINKSQKAISKEFNPDKTRHSWFTEMRKANAGIVMVSKIHKAKKLSY